MPCVNLAGENVELGFEPMKLTSILCYYDLLGIMRVDGGRMWGVEEHSKPREQHWTRPKDVGNYDMPVIFPLNFGGRGH